MQLVRYNPFHELRKVEKDLGKLWENGLGLLPAFSELSIMDMYEEDHSLIAEVNLPDFKRDEIEVTVGKNVLEVTARHKAENESSTSRRYFFRESSNNYLRRVVLPEGVDTTKAEATFRDGKLQVIMPMIESKDMESVLIGE